MVGCKRCKGMAVIPEFMEIKHPLFRAENGDGWTVWERLDDDAIFGFDYLPQNYPAYSVVVFNDPERYNYEAIGRAFEMLMVEGWEIIEERFKDIGLDGFRDALPYDEGKIYVNDLQSECKIVDKKPDCEVSLVIEEDGCIRWYLNPNDRSDVVLLTRGVKILDAEVLKELKDNS